MKKTVLNKFKLALIVSAASGLMLSACGNKQPAAGDGASTAETTQAAASADASAQNGAGASSSDASSGAGAGSANAAGANTGTGASDGASAAGTSSGTSNNAAGSTGAEKNETANGADAAGSSASGSSASGNGTAALSYDIYKELDGIQFEFSSGVGAWQTIISIKEDGSFSGTFYDANMGENSEQYKNGTIYECIFTGQLSEPVKADDTTWKTTVSRLDYSTKTEEGKGSYVEDNTLYILSEPYGLSLNAELEIYTPDKEVSALSEGYMSWIEFKLNHTGGKLGEYGIYNVTDEDGFFPDFYAMGTVDEYYASTEIGSTAYKMIHGAYEAQTMPDSSVLPIVNVDIIPDAPYESVTLKNLQGRWVKRYTEKNGSKVEEILTINGDRGKIEEYVDGVALSAWNGEGTVTLEDRSDRNVCPALRINDSEGNLCTIYIRWVKDNSFYDGGFLNEWIYEPADAELQYLQDTVTIDALQGVWYSEYSDNAGFYQDVLNIDGDNVSIFETVSGTPSGTLNGSGTASVEYSEFTTDKWYPMLKIDMKEGKSKGIAGIYINNITPGRFYDAGLGRWFTRVPTDYRYESNYEDSALSFSITYPDGNNGNAAEIDRSYHYSIKSEDAADASPVYNWSIEITTDTGVNETVHHAVSADTVYCPGISEIIYEEDVNFDGVKDILLFKGSLGTHGVNCYDCYLVDGDKLIKVEGYDEIANPQVNRDAKLINSSSVDNAAEFYERSYRIDGNKAVMVEEIKYRWNEVTGDYTPV